MPVFEYKAKDQEGRAVSGTLFGGSLDAAASDLARRGYEVELLEFAQSAGDPIPAEFGAPRGIDAPRQQASDAGAVERSPGERATGVASEEPPIEDPLLQQRSRIITEIVGPLVLAVPLSALLFFFRQLATMLHAGVGLVQSLDTLTSQTADPRLKAIVRELKEHALAGRPITAGLQRYPEVFTPLMVSLIRVGEEMGTMDQSLRLTAGYIEREIELRNLYRRVTFYPKLVIVASILIIFGANALIGSLAPGAPGLSSPLTSPAAWIILAPLIIGGFLFFRVGVKNPQVRRTYDEILQAIPYLGTTIRQLAMAKFGRAFGTMYAGGVSLPRAVKLAADSCGNEYLRAKMYPAAADIQEGGGVTDAFAKTGAFSPIVLDMTRTGETTGNLDQMLIKTAEFYEEEADVRSRQTGLLFGVVCLLIVAVYIGYVVISFYSGYGAGISAAGG